MACTVVLLRLYYVFHSSSIAGEQYQYTRMSYVARYNVHELNGRD